jgi:hypothetical protein
MSHSSRGLNLHAEMSIADHPQATELRYAVHDILSDKEQCIR